MFSDEKIFQPFMPSTNIVPLLQEYGSHLSKEELFAIPDYIWMLAKTLDHFSLAFTVAAIEGKLILCNHTFLEHIGYSKDDLPTLKWTDITPPKWHQHDNIVMEKLLFSEEPQRYVKEYIKKDGTFIPVELYVHKGYDNSHNYKYVYNFITDLTEHKKAEEAYKLSVARYQAIIEDHSELICRFSPDLTLTFVNKAYCDYFKKKPEDLIGKSFLTLVPEEEHERIKHYFFSLNPGNHVSINENQAIKDDGTISWQEWTNRAIYDKNNQILEYQSIGRDITERKLAEERRFHESEERYRILFNISHDISIVQKYEPFPGLKTKLVEVNKSACEKLGYTKEELLQLSIYDIYKERTKEDFTAIRKKLLNNRYHTFESYYTAKDGSKIPVEIAAHLFEYNREKFILSVARDITERKNLEKQMLQNDRMHLIGEMAAGIGHEIRNPMTTVRGFLELLGEKNDNSQYRDYYSLMIEEIDRANAIIKEYLNLAKDKAISLKEENLNSIINALHPLINAHAAVTDNYVLLDLQEIPNLFLDEKEIRQLILNLARNGIEAMSPGGILTIKTFLDNEEIVLAIEDQGNGVDPDLLDKIGTPFFTTKDHGTGLGLSVCYCIANRHSASIKVDNTSTGATFSVRFGNTLESNQPTS